MSSAIGVVGGGIIGVLAARELAGRHPGARITVLDRDLVGSGASRRSAGLHFPRGASERVRAMAAESEEFYRKLAAADDGTPIYPVPMRVVSHTATTAELREIYLDSAQLTEDDAPGTWTVQGGQYADVYALTGRLATGLRDRVTIREGVDVTELSSTEDGVRIALGTGEELRFDQVVLAPGPWIAAPAWRDLTAPLGVRVKKIVALHVRGVPAPGEPCLVFHDEDAFVLPLAHRGHRLFSYTCTEWDVEPDDLRTGLSADHLAQARAVLDRYVPGQTVDDGRVFCDAYSPDRQPVVRFVDAHERVVFAGAGNGSGYRLGPAIAAEAADLLIPARSRA